jgi:hypothetical protein
VREDFDPAWLKGGRYIDVAHIPEGFEDKERKSAFAEDFDVVCNKHPGESAIVTLATK